MGAGAADAASGGVIVVDLFEFGVEFSEPVNTGMLCGEI